ATRTMDVADYNFDLFDVANAMAAAKKRGVMVRFVTDTDTIKDKSANVQQALGILKSAKIPIVQDERNPIMHDKFTVIDGRWVETGSWNYTDGSTYHDNNNMIVIDSPELAANYTTVFNEMFEAHEFSSVGKIPNPDLTIGGDSVQNCFSPHGGCTDLAVKAIDTAQKSIDFMAFSFTSNPIGNAMLDRAKAGVDVQGVFETTGSNTVYSEYKKMQRAGLKVYTDGNPWNLHHKVIIIDERTVIFGSFNFSASAENDNNENMLVIDDPNLAKAFLTEYTRVLYVAQHPAYKK
ncbi:MAG TPA: phospholipase D-like domain-containing protein, partial [Thermomicrobiaceae bacterium]|nr:phospholipase D-like domain-containing protein [Thermomicrobiaceae bacterium]